MLRFQDIKLFSEGCLQSHGDLSDRDIELIVDSHPEPAQLKAELIRELFQNEDLSVNLDPDLLLCKLGSLEGLAGSIEGYLFLSGQVDPDSAAMLSYKATLGTQAYLLRLVEDFSAQYHDFIEGLQRPEADLALLLSEPRYEVIKAYLDQIYASRTHPTWHLAQSDLKTDLLTGKNELLTSRFILEVANKQLKQAMTYVHELKAAYEQSLVTHDLHALETFFSRYSAPTSSEDRPHAHLYRFHQHLGHAAHIDAHDDNELHFIDIEPRSVNLKKRGHDLVIALEDGAERVICHGVFDREFLAHTGEPRAHLSLTFEWLEEKSPYPQLEMISLDALYRHQEQLPLMNRRLHALSRTHH